MSNLFYIIGASGTGKDTLINYARTKINGSSPVLFAHRYITRPPFTSNENHIHLTEEEFKLRIKANLFALHWESHGKYYGIGNEINTWMQNDLNVVLNGSRQYLPFAQQIYPNLKVILIAASPEVISHRLNNRGREDAAEIEKRIARTAEITSDLQNCTVIQNDGTIVDAGDKLIDNIAVHQNL